MVQADLRSLRARRGRRAEPLGEAPRRSRRRSSKAGPTLAAWMATVGVIGLGYVGLPLAVAFAQEGCEVIAVDVGLAQGRGDRGGRVLHRGRLLRGAARGRRAHPRHHALRAAGQGGRGADLRADAADAQPRARPRPADRRHARAGGGAAGAISWSCSSRPPTRARRASAWRRCWRSRAWRPAGTSIWRSRPSASIPGRTDFTLRNTPKVVGGLTEACARARRGALRAGVRRARARLEPRGGGADEAAREHLPLGEHRARQRAGDADRPHGHRHLGGRRGGRDQAVRVHALRARARAWAGTACRSTPST